MSLMILATPLHSSKTRSGGRSALVGMQDDAPAAVHILITIRGGSVSDWIPTTVERPKILRGALICRRAAHAAPIARPSG